MGVLIVGLIHSDQVGICCPWCLALVVDWVEVIIRGSEKGSAQSNIFSTVPSTILKVPSSVEHGRHLNFSDYKNHHSCLLKTDFSGPI